MKERSQTCRGSRSLPRSKNVGKSRCGSGSWFRTVRSVPSSRHPRRCHLFEDRSAQHLHVACRFNLRWLSLLSQIVTIASKLP